jgi:hypothetical protein
MIDKICNCLLPVILLTLNSSSESAPLAREGVLLPAALSPLSESSLSPYIPRPACVGFPVLKISMQFHNTALNCSVTFTKNQHSKLTILKFPPVIVHIMPTIYCNCQEVETKLLKCHRDVAWDFINQGEVPPNITCSQIY